MEVDIDRLEAAEKDVALKERVIYVLRLELNAVAKERDILSAELSKQQTLTVAAQRIAEVAQIRANQLQAKIEAMEKQEPVATVDANDEGYWAEILPDRSVRVGQKLYTLPDAREQASPVLLADKILEKMSDGREWDTPTLRIALEYPPTRSISTALQKMLADGSIQLVRTVSRGSAHRHVYKRVLGIAQRAAK